MNINYTHMNVLKTPIGRDILKELSSLSWNTAVVKQIDIKGISVSTHSGLKRNRNEDRFAVCVISTKPSVKYFLSIVCDGVGSTQDGDVAATMAIASLVEELLICDSSKNLKLIAKDIVLKTDYKIGLSLQGKGLTTLSIVISKFGSNEVIVANVGDSRVYTWEPSTKSFEQISIDDTFENELKGTALENAEILDVRGLRGTLSQAVGEVNRGQNPLEVNIYELNNTSSSGVILVTDGAWKSDEFGFELISKNSTSSIDAARRVATFSTWSGGIDNISIIAIEDFNFLTATTEALNEQNSSCPKATIWSHDTKLIHSHYLESINKPQVEFESNKNKTSRAPRKSTLKTKSKRNSPVAQLEFETETKPANTKEFSTELQISSNNKNNT